MHLLAKNKLLQEIKEYEGKALRFLGRRIIYNREESGHITLRVQFKNVFLIISDILENITLVYLRHKY